MHPAYLLTDSPSWLQIQQKTGEDWALVKYNSAREPQDWIEWITVRFIVCVYVYFFPDIPIRAGLDLQG